MSVVISPESGHGKEMWKWDHYEDETHPSDFQVRGMRKRAFQPYPAMLYKITARNPLKYDQIVVQSEHEEANYTSRGYVPGGLQAAVDAFDAQQGDLAVMAAVRNYEDRHMSESAKAEAVEAQQASARHLAEIPVAPKKRGRPKKVIE